MALRPRTALARRAYTAALLAAVTLTAGCGVAADATSGSRDGAPQTSRDASTARGSESSPAPARSGTDAASQRVRFKPAELELPGGSTAPVKPSASVDGELVVPEDVNHLGWWDGGAYVNDPFGTTVIAGHVDSAEQGIGYFGQLLTMDIGDEIIVRGTEGEMAYQVTETELIDKEALVSDSMAFDQVGDHRLALITCSGRWRPEVSSYESNYLVMAEPVGSAG